MLFQWREERLLQRSIFLLLLLLIFIVLGDPLASSSAQVLLTAPWERSAQIAQGNNGSTSHYDHGSWDNTYALDIGLKCGTDVLAPADGTVVYVERSPNGMGGREVAIDTGAVVPVFLHLKEIFVELNDHVTRGQVVAKSGNSSFGDGTTIHCHLHFHIWNGHGSYDSHTQPIEHLILKQTGVDSDFREYSSSRHELDDSKIAGHWFESSNGLIPNPAQWHPSGTLVQVPGDDKVYYIGGEWWDARLRWVKDLNAFHANYFDWDKVVRISPDELKCFRPGPDITSTLAEGGRKEVDNQLHSAWYFIGSCATKPSETDGPDCIWYRVSEGTLVKFRNSDAIFVASSWQLHHLALTAQDFEAVGYHWTRNSEPNNSDPTNNIVKIDQDIPTNGIGESFTIDKFRWWCQNH